MSLGNNMEEAIEKKRLRDEERGFKDWEEEFGRSLSIGDEVLFVCDFTTFIGMDSELFKKQCMSLLKIVNINKGRLYIEGDMPFVSNYSKSFFAKSGVNCKHTKGNGQLKIRKTLKKNKLS